MSHEYENTSPKERKTGYGRSLYDYTGVPLDPEHARYPLGQLNGEPYYTASFDHIREILINNTPLLEAKGIFAPGPLNSFLVYVDNSLADAHARRIMYNSERMIPESVPLDDPLMHEVMIGASNASERLQLLLNFPELESIELVKLSHPFDAMAAEQMLDEVHWALLEHGGDVFEVPQDPRYKLKSHHIGPESMSFVRKSVIGCIEATGGKIEVVERRNLIVVDSVDSNLVSHYFFNHESEDALNDVRVLAESRLQAGNLSQSNWLFPIATSCYGRYVPEKLDSE